MKTIITLLLAAFVAIPLMVSAGDSYISPSPQGAKVYFIEPQDGDTVGENVTIRFGLKGMGVSPAGFAKPNTGHHHLIIDGDQLPAMDKPLGQNVKHFGGGQTEAVIKLSKGVHTLQLLLANHLHIPHNPPVLSEKITIIVE